MRLQGVLIIAVLLGVSAVAEPDGVPLTDSTVEPITNAFYYNKAMGFRLQLPTNGWTAVSPATRAEISATNRAFLASQTGGESAGEVHADSTFLVLYSAAKEQPAGIAPSLSGWTEDLGHLSEPLTGAQYLAQLRKHLSDAKLQMKFDDRTVAMKIGGVPFFMQLAQIGVAGDTAFQEQYVTIRNHHAIGFAVVYKHQKDGNTLREAVVSIRFDEAKPVESSAGSHEEAPFKK